MKLFSSFQVKNMTLRNRTVMPPMCMYSAENGMPNAFHFTHYTSRAVGGVGLIIIEATGVMPNGRISDHCLGLWNDEQMHALAPLVSECRRLGAKVAIQLNHAGRKCEADEPVILAPSAIPFDENSKTPHEMDESDCKNVAREAAGTGRSAIGKTNIQ